MTTKWKIEGMSCEHCVRAVQTAVSAVPGVQQVQVDLAAGSAVITHSDDTDLDAVAAAIEEEDFTVAGRS